MQTDSLDLTEKRKKAQLRIQELKAKIEPYLLQKTEIPDGITCWGSIENAQERLMKWFGVSREHWNDWKWQMENRVTDIHLLAKLINISDQQKMIFQRSVRPTALPSPLLLEFD